MESILESQFLILIILGILIMAGIPFFMLIRLLHKIYKRFQVIETELKRLNKGDFW